MKIHGPSHGRPTGPLRAAQIRAGDRYELSDGHAIYVSPASSRHAGRSLDGGSVIGSDPAVKWAGIDAGFSPEPKTLRAPDISVGDLEEAPGWVQGAPPLAVEYADTAQDEADLERKIAELLAAGTKFIWVVRLVGLPRVEIHEPGQGMRTATLDDDLHAPGVLQNPVPVRALFDRETAHQVTFRNLLQRYGYENLEAVRAEGEAQGRAEGEAQGRLEGQAKGFGKALLGLLAQRGFDVDAEQQARIESCRDLDLLSRWLGRVMRARSAGEVLRES